MLLDFLADVWQWASSVPSGREWADALGKQCGAGGAQVVALGMGVDRQRHRRIVAVQAATTRSGMPPANIRLTLVLRRPLRWMRRRLAC
jgi:hypothetical protein